MDELNHFHVKPHDGHVYQTECGNIEIPLFVGETL